MEVLAPDVVLIADGGGMAGAARAPIHGADLVAELLARPDRVESAVRLNGVGRGEPRGEEREGPGSTRSRTRPS